MSRSAQLPPCLILPALILAAGCSQQPAKHTAISETPAYSDIAFKRAISAMPPKVASDPERPLATKSINQSPINSVWDRLLSLYALPEIDNERVDEQLQWYLQHPEYISRIQQRAEPYLYFILNEVEDKQIPGEMALLPAVESAFLPQAYSSSRAAGLWQFIPSTGRFFGLKQNWWYDGRRDVVASTRAATRYLKELSTEFDNDWLLALASYNAGKGNIRKAIRQNNEKDLNTDYWSLDLRQETMNYVPRLLAIAKIFANPEQYNISLQDVPNEPYFEVIDIQSQLDLSKAAEMAQTPIDDFFLLNPAFNRWSTAPDGPHRLLVPIDKAEKFKAKLAALPKKERMKWIRHQVQKGESLSTIAQKHKSDIRAIKNSNHLTSNTIRTGKYLLIPVSHQALKNGLPTMQSAGKVYTVKKGDTFWHIARKFDVSSKDIAHWNQLSLKTPLKPGQKLIIRVPGKATIAMQEQLPRNLDL
jgi:peptidoglycan lytic transglycosylase D